MKLIGMLDSPYVRRVAICLDVLGVPVEHEAVSVFSTFERFRAINPVVKAPTLICDDGGILMDSALILQYIEALRGGPSPLWSSEPQQRLHQFRAVSYATAACDKAVQLAYETQLRPPAAQHEPWKTRVRGQMRSAFDALESLTPAQAEPPQDGELHHASIWSAVVWQCVSALIPAEIPAGRFPKLDQLSQRFETLPLFRRYPSVGPGVPGLSPA
jgi:glutathione S-transferase